MKFFCLILTLYLSYNNLLCQVTPDYRDRVCGLYLLYSGNCSNGVPSDPSYITILVEKSTSSADSIIFTDSLQGLGQPYVRYAKLNLDSTWYSTPGYLGHFKRTDTVFIQNVWYPGPVVCYFDAKKISSIGVTDYQKSNVNFYLYPNPVNDNLHIVVSNYTKPLRFLLYDAAGRLCRGEEFVKSINISTAGLSSGLYYVRVEGEGIYFAKSLVVASDN